ncbi:MAG TPA: helix-turn-helix domain-containing protein [Saprospiraceae bacterium]|jgi:DNA-binding transcriptional regulator GbsR (MarR family)|nr:helix-turn-helix domain-containing protein [Saprospiraceae bacterium]
MNYQETKEEFIQLWGSLGSNWGINKAMAQIHAILLASENPMTTDEIMEELKISRSNSNLNIRALIDWGLVYKKHVAGDRKEYFIAEKDMWQVAIKIMRERRKREIEPLIRDLKRLSDFETKSYEDKKFKNLLDQTVELSEKLSSIGNAVEKVDKNSFFKWIMKLF